MKKRKVTITRRQLLRGASGFALGLPFLPSLVPGRAYAQEVSFDPGKRFVAIATNHGGIRPVSMFPDESLLTESMTLYPGMDIRRGDLSRAVNGDRASLSPVLTAGADRLTDSVVSKMNVLFGVDIPFYIAHHTGGHLGNYARNDGNGSDGQAAQQQPMPTIDQLMAWSPSFYGDLRNVTLRTLITGSMGRLSWNWSNPSTRSGDIQEVPPEYDAGRLFDQVFVTPDAPSDPAQPRTPLVDLVIESYRSLRQSNRRMGSDDRQRLDDHMDRLAELQRRLSTNPVRLATCEGFVAPSANRSEFAAYHRDLNDVITAAFLCGTSRIAVLGVVEADYENYAGDWHQEIAHQWYDDGPQQRLVDANQQVFERVFADLAYRLDVEESPGVTVLDNTLMTWSQESGEWTHDARSMPIVTAGSAGGFLRTGQFCDYRNRVPTSLLYKDDRDPEAFTGLTYQQWLATCLQAMGLPPSEWQDIQYNGTAGYGYPFVDDAYRPTHVRGVLENASEVMPFLKA